MSHTHCIWCVHKCSNTIFFYVLKDRWDAYEISLFNINVVHLPFSHLFNMMFSGYLSSFKWVWCLGSLWWWRNQKRENLCIFSRNISKRKPRLGSMLSKVVCSHTHCGITLGHFMSIKRSQSVMLIRNICLPPVISGVVFTLSPVWVFFFFFC